MIDLERETLAYLIVGVVLLVAIPLLISYLHRRKREKLRRRGVKKYGH